MSLAAGGYIIYPIINENRTRVLCPLNGAKKANTTIYGDALYTNDNRCYWTCTTATMTINNVIETVNYFSNKNTGTSAGYITPATTKKAPLTVSSDMGIQQRAKNTTIGCWIVTQDGTDTVNGVTVPVHTIKLANYPYYLTADEDGNLFLEGDLDDDTQRFYFEPTIYYNTKLTEKATPSSIVDYNTGNAYLIYSENGFTPLWNMSNNITTYQARRRYQQENADGTWTDWTDWMAPDSDTKTGYTSPIVDNFTGDGSTTEFTLSQTPAGGSLTSVKVGNNTTTAYTLDDITLTFNSAPANKAAIVVNYLYEDVHGWTNITATSTKVQKSTSYNFVSDTVWNEPVVDNNEYMSAKMEIEIRPIQIKSGVSTHGISTTTIMDIYKTPTITLSGVLITSDTVEIAYSNIDYVTSDSKAIITIRKTDSNGAVLIENYESTYTESSGTLSIAISDFKTFSPQIGDTLYVYVKAGAIHAQNSSYGIFTATGESETDTSSGTGEGDSQSGSGPTAGADLITNIRVEETDRLTYLLHNDAHTNDICYIQVKNLNGDTHTTICDIYSKGNNEIVFEIPGAFNDNTYYTLSITSDNKWCKKNGTITPINTLKTLYYGWYWVDLNGVHQAAILRYQVNDIMKPNDSIDTENTEYITTGRQYPVFRFGKTVKRDLSISGIILNSETTEYYTKAAFDKLATAHHAWFRRPDGMVQEVAIDGVKYNREEQYLKVDISQKAETR